MRVGARLALRVGQRDETAMSVTSSSLVSLALQHAPDHATFYVLDGTPADSHLSGILESVARHLPHRMHFIEWRDVAEAIAENLGLDLLIWNIKSTTKARGTSVQSILAQMTGPHSAR